jgi:N-acetylneuraminic acid mutarotase
VLFLGLGLCATVQAQLNEWTWMGGSSTVNQSGVYGTRGTPAAGNLPGSRDIATTWTDSSGNFWLFGGFGFDVNGTDLYLGDLWEFNPSTNEWTWMGGSNTAEKGGIYGTLGTPAAGNVPGCRAGASSWTDSSGNFWFFGGNGCSSLLGIVGNLNDLWEFNPSTNEWAWMSGNSVYGYQSGVYGTLGTPAAGNTPGSRGGASNWTDLSGNLWLFGGSGVGSLSDTDYLSDLWEFNPSTSEWTWMGGSNTANQSGVYGTLGTPAAGNIPGGRYSSATWTDPSGNFWLFGGYVYNVGELNDLWEYNTSTNQWAWISGSSAGTQPGVYGTLGTPAAGNMPGGRFGASSWIDSSGNFWLFGGQGFDAQANCCNLNDLWEFNPSTSEWTWMSGSSTGYQPGVYGTLGTPAAGNVPGGGRDSSLTWTDPSGNLWLFGGLESGGSGNRLNDLWRYQLSATTLAAAATPTFSVPGGTYATAQTVTISDATADATIYYTTNGTTPTTGSSVYSSAITVSSTETLEAIATASGSTTSALETAAYTITSPAATPIFSVPAGTYITAQTVSISDTTSGAAIYYTTNGTTPSTSSTVYNGAITVSATETLEALATASGYSISAVATATYTITQPVAPSFTISSITGPQTVQPGGAATYSITVTAQNGTFPNPVTLTASGLPAGATAIFSPPSVTPGSSSASSTLTIQTANPEAALTTKDSKWPLTASALSLIGMFFLPGKRRRRWITLTVLLLASLGAFTALTACGGGFGFTSSATSYTITITGSSGSVQQTTTVPLTVE